MKKEIMVIDHDKEVFEHIRDAFENEVISASYVYTAEEGLFRMRMKRANLRGRVGGHLPSGQFHYLLSDRAAPQKAGRPGNHQNGSWHWLPDK